jgi:hypothetical protein
VESPEGRVWYSQRIRTGPFACSVKCPKYVDDQSARASFEQGVLTITCPKRKEAMSCRIPVERPDTCRREHSRHDNRVAWEPARKGGSYGTHDQGKEQARSLAKKVRR